MGGGGGGLFSGFGKHWKVGEALASSGLSLLFPKAVPDDMAKMALDPLNMTGMNTEEVEPIAEEETEETETVDTTVEDIEADSRSAAQAEANRIRRRKGYKSTVLTTMGGIPDTPPTLKKTLGGV